MRIRRIERGPTARDSPWHGIECTGHLDVATHPTIQPQNAGPTYDPLAVRYCVGLSPKVCRNTREKSCGDLKPQRVPMSETEQAWN